jgi:hypothetical protein
MKEATIEQYCMDKEDIYITTFANILFRAYVVRHGVCIYATNMYISPLEAFTVGYEGLIENRKRNFNEVS